MRPPTRSSLGLSALLLALTPSLSGQSVPGEDQLKQVETRVSALNWELDAVRKAADDQLWFLRLSDVAVVDKVTYTGPPNPKGEETYGIKNERHPLKIQQYVFVPRKAEKGRKLPLIVLPHGGVHGDFGTYHVHIVREMIERGYIVIAPDYRGSTGYGRGFYEAIDYGGLEIDDVVAGRDWAVEHLPVDPKRCAIVGWSHGGLIALMAVFDHPEKFAASYAGVPVSDLITRLGYLGQDYVAEFSAKFHIGKEPKDAVDEYRRRSPVWNVQKLRTPLLIHTNTNDRDVNVVEVEQLINALKAAGKTFESRIYQDAPGGHSFNRIDTTLAQESRKEIYAFLDKHLK
ncbi:alpha/beta hydrolase family protein [Geothrix campi]|jgi:dipeptidyl aminopeptidase/acylaminoacyl peptidase|uniref:alpha/beta hydrolase family protein n=1 Tax=Geothrix campi TaxID=2966450 RepID=UPI002147DE49|nr:alpha/beta fold hydrolase [Geothrix sp. SG10]